MKIKQLVLIIILILSLIGFLAPSLFAAEMQVAGTDDSLRADNPGILQTNPFYFVKEWGRGIGRIFTFNPVSKLQYDFQVATDKAAELKRLEEIGTVDSVSLRAALLNYSDNLKTLGVRLATLPIKSDEVLNIFVSNTSEQNELLESLKSRHADLKTDIEAAQAYLREISEAALAK